MRSFHILTKPIGPICNLDCKYCFYLEKEALYPENKDARSFRMSDEVLERYIPQYIDGQDVPEIWFAWQGGEPTLMGLPFFKKVVALQRRHCPPGKSVRNAIQTNGTLLDADWCNFLRDEAFLVGLSIDGPRDLHDHYRVDRGGKGTFDQVMVGWELLKKHGVEYNTLTVISNETSRRPIEVYEFLKQNGSHFMQFIPLVERVGPTPGRLSDPPALSLSNGPRLRVLNESNQVTPWSVEPALFGEFLVQIFDHWVRRDIGECFVQLFDVQLEIEMGMGSSICLFGETCGKALAIEHNGDLFSCDHFVYPDYKLGNLRDQTLTTMVESPQQKRFGNDKRDTLPQYCQKCEVKMHCNGECPKHRFLTTPDGEPGLNYLCAGYKRFFNHAKPYLGTMADLLRKGRAPAEIMGMLKARRGF